eukprot:5402808-Ditylum_brightwellii.AAC.1
MHRLSEEGIVIGITNCIGVSLFGAQGKFHEESLHQRGYVLHYLGECIHAIKDVLHQDRAFTVMGGFHTCESSSPAGA